ncbi:MAG: electron transport complex subunit RsxC [Candidatus Omnitrophota bacterium]
MAVKLEEHKSLSEHKAIEKMPVPAKVYIPLSQHLGKPCVSLVKSGDQVLVGQKIASLEAKIFAPIHSSVSGKVLGIQNYPHPVLGQAQAIVIENDGQDSRLSSFVLRPSQEIDALTSEQIRNIVFEAGIVGMGGASFPTYIKLTPPKPLQTMIVNGAECEPYLTADYRLMVEKTREILKGIDLVSRCLGAKEGVIAIEDNKPEAIRAFNSEISVTDYRLRILKSQYPQGGEKQLIKSVVRKEVPPGKLPFDIGVSVHNVGTVFAVYEAVYLNKPLYERVVTVTGKCVSNPKNLLVRIGTPIKELISFCGPLTEEPAKIISGGPMMGIAQWTDEVPVIKSTTGIVLMNKQEVKTRQEEFCIRCGACVRNCPAGLMPTLINLASQKERWQDAKFYGASDCIECGLCSYICPSNINLVQSIRRAKGELR